MFNRLALTPNAYFYKVIKSISNNKISNVLADAATDKNGHNIFLERRKPKKENGRHFLLSLVIFKREVSPSFLIPGNESENKFCYLLLVEYDNFLIVSRTGTSEFLSPIEKNIESINYQAISEYKLNANTKIAKLNVSNLDTAPNAMRRSAYEAKDVKETLPTLTMSNKVVTGLKLTNSGANSTIAPNTSRINDQGKRSSISHFCNWAAVQCEELGRFKHSANYLDHFAEPLDFKTHAPSLKVISVLFNLSGILDGLEDGSIVGVDYLSSNGFTRNININLLSETHDLCLDVSYDKALKKQIIKNEFDKSLQIVKYKNRFGISSNKLDRIRVHFTTGEVHDLLSLINKQSLFVLSFDSIDIRYSQKTLFRDTKLINNFSNFLKAFEPHSLLNGANSEKGTCIVNSKKFDKGCLFETIESKFASDCDYLICDDLGDEWADYIGFKKDDFIRFYHAKHSTKGFSASAFHDIVSQALKNIGNFNFNQNLNKKRVKIGELYGKTKIHRLRFGNSVNSCFKNLTSTYNNPKATKEVVLVVNFISKRELENQLKLLKSGKSKNQTIQILWILTSLFSICREKGIGIRILTKP